MLSCFEHFLWIGVIRSLPPWSYNRRVFCKSWTFWYKLHTLIVSMLVLSSYQSMFISLWCLVWQVTEMLPAISRALSTPDFRYYFTCRLCINVVSDVATMKYLSKWSEFPTRFLYVRSETSVESLINARYNDVCWSSWNWNGLSVC